MPARGAGMASAHWCGLRSSRSNDAEPLPIRGWQELPATEAVVEA